VRIFGVTVTAYRQLVFGLQCRYLVRLLLHTDSLCLGFSVDTCDCYCTQTACTWTAVWILGVTVTAYRQLVLGLQCGYLVRLLLHTDSLYLGFSVDTCDCYCTQTACAWAAVWVLGDYYCVQTACISAAVWIFGVTVTAYRQLVLGLQCGYLV
jgi:hypothetical protein